MPNTPSNPKYPHIKVRLTGEDGNAFAVLGKAGVPDDERYAFQKEATAGDYDHLLQVVMRTVEVS